MKDVVKSLLQSVQFGEPQILKRITIVPLIAPTDGTFQYRSLSEALNGGDLAITEVSNAGSVPELLVVNRSTQPVLLIDGEELAGAKQNRVLNTSILLKETSQTKIPVSCTEQGRWSYSSKMFSDSGYVMAHKTRSRKTSSVHASLVASGAYNSDQSEVWAGIVQLQAKSGTKSPTWAMHDVFKARDEELRHCDDAFKSVPNQIGCLAFIDGQPAGLDMVSRISTYSKLHTKLVRSYTLEGLLGSKDQSSNSDDIANQTRKFLDEIIASEETQFPSVGHGTDHRFKAKALAGTALIHENEVIHAAFFRLDETEKRNTPPPLGHPRPLFS